MACLFAPGRLDMSRAYDELAGPMGRGIHFRPARTRVRNLFNSDVRATLRFAGATVPVMDLSMNGLSVTVPNGAPIPPIGTEIDASLYLGERLAFQGRLRLARLEPLPVGTTLGLAVVDSFIDLPALARRVEEERLDRDLALGGELGQGLVSEEYLLALQRVVAFVQYYRSVLSRHEARCRAEGAEYASQALRELETKALTALRDPWNRLRQEAYDAVKPLIEDRARRAAARSLTQALLTPLLMECPCVARSYLKPLGYPGDYQVMVYCYEDALEGDTVFGRVFHKLWIEHPMPAGVRTRCDLVVGLILHQQDHLDEGSGDLRVTLLGCGPAREIVGFVGRRPTWRGSVRWSLLDQEEEALSLAWRTARPLLAGPGRAAELRCYTLSFTRLLQDPGILPVGDGEDVIGCSGLFDYLRDPLASRLVREMYDRLRPGGLLAVGNAIGPDAELWSPEMVLDWPMTYRSADEMRALASLLPADAEIDVQVESGKAYHFLVVRRPKEKN